MNYFYKVRLRCAGLLSLLPEIQKNPSMNFLFYPLYILSKMDTIYLTILPNNRREGVSSLKAARTPKKQDSIAEVLRDAILSGDIPGGTEMTQQELAEGLGVSRMPVREALILLEYQGLVQRLSNNRIRVARISRDSIREVFALCAELELNACQQLSSEAVQQIITAPKQALQSLLSPLPEILRLHHELCDSISNPFTQRTLRTILVTYVDYASRSPRYQRDEGERLFTKALTATHEERTQLLQTYFKKLEDSFF